MSQTKVLVVEDDLLVLRLSSDSLEHDGLDVVEAETADQAAEILRAADANISVVFADIKTPGRLSGLDLAQVAHDRWPTILVILTSGVAVPILSALPDRTRFLPKPYDLQKLAKLIKALVGTWRLEPRIEDVAGAAPMPVR